MYYVMYYVMCQVCERCAWLPEPGGGPAQRGEGPQPDRRGRGGSPPHRAEAGREWN